MTTKEWYDIKKVAKSRVQVIDLGPGTRQALGVMSEE
jgi:hypothetical protein